MTGARSVVSSIRSRGSHQARSLEKTRTTPPMRASRVMPHAIVACAAVTLRAHITHYHCAACTR
ncbi:hypothetical protein L810_5305 [Burkholderia sp. AU4i]|nr:hypothetical protein L810_5305 [Burkholderia sp. AU4i]